MNRIATTAALAGLLAAGAAHAQDRRGPPGGSPGSAQMPPAAGQMQQSAIPAPMKTAGTATGSFEGTCRNTTTSNGRVFSECRAPDGQYRRSSIEYGKCLGDIGNQNGILACNGAVAQDGGIVAEAQTPSRDSSNRDTGRSSSANRGALLGGLLGAGAASTGGYGQNGYGQNGYGQGGANNGAYGDGGYNRGGYPQPPNGYGDRDYPPPPPPSNRYGYGDYPPPPPPPPPPRGGYGSNGYGVYPQGGYDDRGYDRGGGPSIVLYDGYNYTGRAFEVRGDIDNLRDEGFNDRARSVRIYSGRWKLCREAEQSRCEHVSRDVPDLRTINAADQISSVERE